MKKSIFVTCVAVSGLAVAGGLLTACSSEPDAEPAAKALAKALETGTFADVSLGDQSAKEARTALTGLTDGMGDVERTVAVGSISDPKDDRREVTLEWTWNVDQDTDDDWTYRSTAELTLDSDEWQVEWAPTVVHPKLTKPESQLVLHREQAKRGEVLGADGEVLVSDRPVYRVGVDKTQVGAASATDAAAELAAVVDVDSASFVSRVEESGPKAFVEAITLREADAADVLDAIGQIKGAVALPGSMPLAPTREFARPILGTVGEATAEIIKESDGGIGVGDVVGLSALQRQFDEKLRGRPALSVEMVRPSGEGTVIFEQPAAPGKSVSTTLDIDLQMAAEEVLADVGPPSALVAIRPSTGAVVAASSGPGSEGYSTATQGQYAPGSTFKLVTALALLRAGMSPDDVLTCTETITVDGKSFKNYDDYPSSAVGDISLRSVVANSCNTALISQADRVTQRDLTDAAAALGLGTGTDSIGIDAFMGDVPPSAATTGHAASMIGQGKVLASPLAMATVAASIAAGETVAPHLVGDAPEPGGSLTADEASVLRELMRAVVEEGSGEFLLDVPGEPVGAKTGTAEYGSGDPLPTHAWMVATQGDLAVAAFVEEGESGSRTAGPILEEFLAGQ